MIIKVDQEAIEIARDASAPWPSTQCDDDPQNVHARVIENVPFSFALRDNKK
ncbi:hypothetical protein SERLADRAFT_462914 [Serpula lacrymans var. lacrymans S7.9]|uniref:Uncharacterized protein n=1 Tax=Serpula lacrymans var. lacrymans (strain S7.9) TaxID=578457 RepID=F8NQT7_SERL9|nr:uncharacterized protein SERLADRAFT_462914 [Serpula lacrymans var. lacrymans S7.9]EGO26163.1 hypothetical protein SERLADRAFT_462914 [Serpula lacrymans var. lacrymans S7.9]